MKSEAKPLTNDEEAYGRDVLADRDVLNEEESCGVSYLYLACCFATLDARDTTISEQQEEIRKALGSRNDAYEEELNARDARIKDLEASACRWPGPELCVDLIHSLQLHAEVERT